MEISAPPDSRHRAARRLLRILQLGLLLLGLASILLGAGADLLRSSGDPGLGGAQIGLILVGLALMLSAYALQSPTAEAILEKALQHAAQVSLAAILAVLVITAILEAGLVVRGMPTQSALNQGIRDLSPATWWACDSLGCRFDPARVNQAPTEFPEGPRRDAARIFFERLRVVNSQGFHDTDEFVPPPLREDTAEGVRRVLVLGDSHAFGFYAPLGESWVDRLPTALALDRPPIVWNTGIPGASTVQELEILKHFLPILKPDLVILGFYPGNDLDGNLHPVDNFYASDRGMLFLKHKIGPGFEPIPMSPAAAYQRATGLRVASDLHWLEAGLGRTRLGTLFLRAWTRLYPGFEWLWSAEARWAPGPEDKRAEAEARTTRLLRDIQSRIDLQESKLLVLLIPGPKDLQDIGPRYRRGQGIVEGLRLPTYEPLDHLTPDDYVPDDEHWNAGGHAKVAQLLAQHIHPLLSFREPLEHHASRDSS